MKSQNIIYLCWFLILGMTAFVTAQQNSPVPLPAYDVVYAKDKNKFYILGGQSSLLPSEYLGQFFALDLSKAWKSTSPAWIQLQDGPKQRFTGAAMSLDGNILMALSDTNLPSYRYFVHNNTWSPSRTTFRNSMTDVYPVTLGTDGTAFIVGGSSSTPNMSAEYDSYTFSTDHTVTAQLPATGIGGASYLPARQGYRAVWSEYLKSVVFYGGSSSAATDQWVTLFQPETKQWRMLQTSGINNVTSLNHCMAISDNGKTVYVFGGLRSSFFDQMNTSDRLFILDLETGKWREASSISSYRMNAACTVAGDYFLLWGGRTNSTVIDGGHLSSPVLIYQISQNAWTTEYRPSVEYLDLDSISPQPSGPAPSGAPGNSQNSENAPNIGAIAGGASGTFVVIGLIAFILWRRKNQATKQSKQESDSPMGDSLHNHQSDEKRDDHQHSTDQQPRIPFRAKSKHSPQYEQECNEYADEYQDRSRGRELGATNHAGLFPTSKPASAPHYPSWGANMDSNIPYLKRRENAPHTIQDDPTQDPSLAPLPPNWFPGITPLSQRRHPQALDGRLSLQRKMGDSQALDGIFPHRRPGPQLYPK